MAHAMMGQVASWDEGLAISFDCNLLKWLDGWDTDRHISIVTEGRTIIICPDDGKDTEPELRRRVTSRGLGSHSDFRHGATFSWNVVQGDDLPRFALYEARWSPGNGGFYVYTDLPPDHLLPWPKLRDCASYDVPSQIQRDLVLRMRSARDASLGLAPSKWTMEPLPKKFRDRLPPDAYAACLRQVIAEVREAA